MDIRFNKTQLDRLPPAAPGRRDVYRDIDFPGLSLRVTDRGVKSFIIIRRVEEKVVRVTLGRHPLMTVEQARRKAVAELAILMDGRNPNTEHKVDEKRLLTLRQMLEDYLTARKALKNSTREDYRKRVREMFSDWQDKPLVRITRDMIAQRHSSIGARSQAQADRGMRVLRALFNFAQGAYEDGQGRPILGDNPVKRLTHTRAWYGTKRRRTRIKPHQLKAWFEATLNLKPVVEGDSTYTVRDYLIFVLLTGLRREEAASLRWADVDLVDQTFTIPDPKNREPHTLPMSDAVQRLLDYRRKADPEGDFVFASAESKRGYLQNPYKPMKRIIAASNVSFNLHDLRRTFTTTAESLDLSPYTIKRLINHSLPGDVTAGYIVIDAERLREPIQRVADAILKAAETNILQLARQQSGDQPRITDVADSDEALGEAVTA